MRTSRTVLTGLAALVALGAVGAATYWLGMNRGMSMAARETPANAATSDGANSEQGEEATRRHIRSGLKAGDIDPATGQKILYYRDPMVPGNKFDKPAKSPFMDMMLVPVYAGAESGDESKVTVSPRVQQNLGVRTAVAAEGQLSTQFAAVGSIAYNERDQAIVQARATGFVERLHVRATLDRVARGQPLVEIYVPEWIAAQEEFLAVRRMQGTNLPGLVDGARQRMRQAGMNEAQIAQVESSGTTQPRITLQAPIAGVIAELAVREGMTVMSGATLFRINGIGTVWANAEVPESQSALLRPGARVQARSPAVPGETFDGKVQALLPDVSPATRTLKARVELANPRGRLVPGMFVQMQFMDMRAEKALLVPTEAVIQTGRRSVVLLAEDNGRFRPVDVETGIESEGRTEIKRGLQAGQRVVVSSQFLIDSEASLRGVEARLNAEPPASAAGGAQRHRGEATVEAVGRDSVTLSHGAIPSVQWPAMTMEFKASSQHLPSGLRAGDRVNFEFTMDAGQQPQITAVTIVARASDTKAADKPSAEHKSTTHGSGK